MTVQRPASARPGEPGMMGAMAEPRPPLVLLPSGDDPLEVHTRAVAAEGVAFIRLEWVDVWGLPAVASMELVGTPRPGDIVVAKATDGTVTVGLVK